jgi:O-antigen biosynthesis protein
VTIVAHELRGFVPVGGMGTATSFLALALARMGHAVELLLGIHTPASLDPYWEAAYRDAGVKIRRVPTNVEPVTPWPFVHGHAVQLGLQAQRSDVVIGHDFGSPLYSALRLRQAGVGFEGSLFVVFCHGTRAYLMDESRTVGVKDLRHLLEVTIHEQAAIELADVVVSPSAYLVDWMRRQGWRLPEQTLVIPYFTRATATGEQVAEREWHDGERLHRLAFFGRLDERKGLKLFAAALNAIDDSVLAGVELEFLGRPTASWPRDRVEALLSERTKSALRGISFETQLDQHDALARLSRPGTLAVMPSLQENSPNAVYECLEHRIPFVASNVGGVPELVAPGDRTRTLFEPTDDGVEQVLRRVLTDRRVPRPADAAYSSEAAFERWGEVVQLRPPARPVRAEGRVDVVVVQRSSGATLERCLSALERQTHTDFHVSVSEGSSVEAARDMGRRAGSAPYVVFLDEEDVPDEQLLKTLIRAQQASGADVVTCGVRLVTGDGQRALRFFTGEPGGLGVLSNAYGTVGLYRRDILHGVENSWPSDKDADWPLLAALNAAGARIVSIPEPLVTRSARPESVERDPTDALLAVEHVERTLPDPLRATARLAAGLAADAPLARSTRRLPLLRRLLRGDR